MVEITKMLDGVWKRKSVDDDFKRPEKPTSDTKKSPDRNLKKEKRYSWSPGKTDLEFNIKSLVVDEPGRNSPTRVRPKSYAEPSGDLGKNAKSTLELFCISCRQSHRIFNVLTKANTSL